MPHTRSAKKSVRRIAARNQRNRAAKSAIKTQIKKFTDIVKSGSPDVVQAEFKIAAKKLDKAAAKRVIHPNQAARKKSQLAKMINRKTGTGTPAKT
jgi:small subunit ribosomal protein S20